MKQKKEEMMAKFEKLLKKGKHLNKDEFYKQIFNENYSPFASKEFAGGDLNSSENNFEKEENLFTNKKEEEPTQNKNNNNNSNTKHNESFTKNETSVLNQSISRDKSKKIDNKSVTQAVEDKHNESFLENREDREQRVKYLTMDEIKEKVDEKKGGLEHSLLDVITKNEIEEKKILESIQEEDAEDEKEKKNEIYNEEKSKNEQKIAQLQE